MSLLLSRSEVHFSSQNFGFRVLVWAGRVLWFGPEVNLVLGQKVPRLRNWPSVSGIFVVFHPLSGLFIKHPDIHTRVINTTLRLGFPLQQQQQSNSSSSHGSQVGLFLPFSQSLVEIWYCKWFNLSFLSYLLLFLFDSESSVFRFCFGFKFVHFLRCLLLLFKYGFWVIFAASLLCFVCVIFILMENAGWFFLSKIMCKSPKEMLGRAWETSAMNSFCW